MKKIIKLIGFLALILLLFLIYFTLIEYNPKEEEKLLINNKVKGKLPIEIKLLTWNLGYGGMGKEMDFFMDGGTRQRPKEVEVRKNLDGILDFLNGKMDIYLLQEVDEVSRRTWSYSIKEEIIEKLSDYQYSYGYNYVNQFVPKPLNDPIGKVKSGLLLGSKYNYKSAKRIPLPGQYSWPIRVFHLKRAMVEIRYDLGNEKELIVVNTHNSAFDDGSLREQQMKFIKDIYNREYLEGNYVIIGGDWNLLLPKTGVKGEFLYEMPKIPEDFFDKGWKWVFEKEIPTIRDASKIYDGTNSTAIIDGFLLSPNIENIYVKTHNLNFEFTDHNPVEIGVRLR